MAVSPSTEQQDQRSGLEAPPGPDKPAAAVEPAKRQKSLTIGAVCKALAQEFPDISISKIRYLEDQKLLAPRGPRRLPALHPGRCPRCAILRMQRDEFLPLRAIRQELRPGAVEEAAVPAVARAAYVAGEHERPRGDRRAALPGRRPRGDQGRRQARARARGVRRRQGRDAGRRALLDDTECEIIAAVAELARYGVGGRNLRVFRSSADREANLLQQILAPALRSRNPERRKEAVEALENLAVVATHLKHLLLIRDLRKIVR
jgi:hypothetical protein